MSSVQGISPPPLRRGAPKLRALQQNAKAMVVKVIGRLEHPPRDGRPLEDHLANRSHPGGCTCAYREASPRLATGQVLSHPVPGGRPGTTCTEGPSPGVHAPDILAEALGGSTPARPTVHDGIKALTEGERQILRLLLTGHDLKSVAAALALSISTVNERMTKARRKLGASSSRQAARMLGEVEREAHLSAPREQSGATLGPEPLNGQTLSRVASSGQPLVWVSLGMLVMSLIIAAAVVAVAIPRGGAISTQLAGTSAFVVAGARGSASASE